MYISLMFQVFEQFGRVLNRSKNNGIISTLQGVEKGLRSVTKEKQCVEDKIKNKTRSLRNGYKVKK